MDDKQQKFVSLLTTKIMESINEVNNKALSEGTNINAQTYFLLIDMASAIAHQLKIPKKEQIECLNYFIKQNKQNALKLEVELNKKIKNSSVELNLDLMNEATTSSESDSEESGSENLSEEISLLFSDDFIAKKEKN